MYLLLAILKITVRQPNPTGLKSLSLSRFFTLLNSKCLHNPFGPQRPLAPSLSHAAILVQATRLVFAAAIEIPLKRVTLATLGKSEMLTSMFESTTYDKVTSSDKNPQQVSVYTLLKREHSFEQTIAIRHGPCFKSVRGEDEGYVSSPRPFGVY